VQSQGARETKTRTPRILLPSPIVVRSKGRLEGELALSAFVAGATQASYFILLTWAGERVKAIRDFRYVPYIAAEAEFET
jgi:hypothetical protein